MRDSKRTSLNPYDNVGASRTQPKEQSGRLADVLQKEVRMRQLKSVIKESPTVGRQPVKQIKTFDHSYTQLSYRPKHHGGKIDLQKLKE